MDVPFHEQIRLWGSKMLDLLPSLSRSQRARLDRELAALVQRAKDGGYTSGEPNSSLWDECSAEFMSAMCLAGEVFKKQQQQKPGDAPPPGPGPSGINGVRIKF